MSFVSRLLDRGSANMAPPPSNGTLTFEPMRKRHLRAVMAIEQQAYPNPWTPGVFTTELDEARAGRRVYLVALIDGVVVGYGGLMLVVDEAHISNVAVDPRLRRRHLGTRLMVELMSAAREQQAVAVSLEVRISNVAAQSMYAKFGFAAEGVRHKYYENVEDAVVMWCRNVDSPDYAAKLRLIERAL